MPVPAINVTHHWFDRALFDHQESDDDPDDMEDEEDLEDQENQSADDSQVRVPPRFHTEVNVKRTPPYTLYRAEEADSPERTCLLTGHEVKIESDSWVRACRYIEENTEKVQDQMSIFEVKIIQQLFQLGVAPENLEQVYRDFLTAAKVYIGQIKFWPGEDKEANFGAVDRAWILGWDRFEDRLLAILYVHLLRQEFLSRQIDDVWPARSKLFRGACMWEAWRWRLDLLEQWSDNVAEFVENVRTQN